jgi:hypothetical protein
MQITAVAAAAVSNLRRRNTSVKRTSIATLLLLALAVPAVAKTHKDVYNVTCSTLWPAVKDVLRNSGKYGIIGIDSTEMTASYNIGGSLGGKRINSLVLNTQGTNCELQVQTAFSGLVHEDYGDFKKRVDASLAKLQAAQPAPAAQPASAAAPAPATQPAPADQAAPAKPAPSSQPTPPPQPTEPKK